MKIALSVSIILLAAIGARAQNYTPMPPTEADAAPDTPVVPWKKFCGQLIAHQPVSNVMYDQFGQQCDVHGRPVASADLRGPQNVTMPRAYRMFITAQQARDLNIAMPNAAINNDLLIGEVTVGPNGTVTFDGQPVQTDRLYRVCQTLD